MTTTMLVSLGVFGGTMLSFVLNKKRDFRTGLSVGIGVAMVAGAFLSLLF